MENPKFKVGDLVKHLDEGKPRKIVAGPVKDAHVEAYVVEGLSGVVPADVLAATEPESPPPAAA